MKLSHFDIPFSGLKSGEHKFDFRLSQSFFEQFGYEDFNAVDLNVKVVLDKRATLMDLCLETQGTVNVDCDLTNEPFDLPLDGTLKIVVKFGDSFNDDNEDLLVLPHGEYKLNPAQYIYEMVVLAMPQKKVHPGVEDGTLQSDVLDRLTQMQVEQPSNTVKEQRTTDPRWDALKKLKET